MSVRETLEEGYQSIERAWYQDGPHGVRVGAGPSYECAVSMLRDCPDRIRRRALRVLHGLLPSHTCGKEAVGKEADCLITWNDAPERTQQDVLDLYKEAIANAPLEES